MKILVCGGGTGGHIYPALAVVAELQEMGLEKEDMLWIGTQGEIEESLVPKAGLRLETITGGAVVGVPWRERVVNLTRLAYSLGKSSRIMGSFQPEVLLLTGGYVNVPVAIAAWLRRIPALIFLPDIEPGMAIRYLNNLANRVACTAEESKAYFKSEKVAVTGYPVRPELRDQLSVDPAEALAQFNLGLDRPTLFVFGGSRGARSINRALMTALTKLLDRIQIIHVTGMLDWPDVKRNGDTLTESQRRFYRPYPYLHGEMGLAFRSADLVLARAGASMLGECPAFGLPAILVPYPHAWRYQKVNADYMAERGASITIADEDLPSQLAERVLALLFDRPRLKKMAAAAEALDKPDSTKKLAQLLLDLG